MGKKIFVKSAYWLNWPIGFDQVHQGGKTEKQILTVLLKDNIQRKQLSLIEKYFNNNNSNKDHTNDIIEYDVTLSIVSIKRVIS